MMNDTGPSGETQDSLGARKLLAALLLLYALAFAAKLPNMFFGGQTLLLFQAAAYGVLGIGGIFIFRHSLISGLNSWKASAPKNILWIVGAFAASMFAASLAALPAHSMGYEGNSSANAVSLMVKAAGKPLAVLAIGLFGPILEECIYRAFLIGKIKPKLPLWMRVVMSSFLFACAHLRGFGLLDFLGMLPIFAQGFIYGAAYAATGNITIPMAMHIANNMTAIALYAGQ
jgi:membrane protease YdiL (CAAX protease family)